MNKNFSEEYKKFADIDTPDLWSRIEAGVDALEDNLKESKDDSQAPADNKIINIASSPRYTADNSSDTDDSTENADKANDDKAGRLNDQRKTVGFGESRFAVFARKYGGMVAAVACGVAVLSVIGIQKLASKGDYSAAPMAESAAPAAMAEAPSDAAMSEAADEAEMETEEAANEAPMVAEEAPAMAEEAVEEAEAYATEAEKSEESYDMADEAPAADTYAAGATNGSHDDFAADATAETFSATLGIEESKRNNINAVSDTDELTMEIGAGLISITGDKRSKGTEDNMLSCGLTVTDPGESGLKKGEEITAYVDPSMYETVTSIQGKGIDKTKQYKITLTYKDGKYILTEIR